MLLYELAEPRGLLSYRVRALQSGEGLDAGDGAAEDEAVDVVGAFVGVDGFEVLGVAHDVELGGDAVAAVDVAGGAGDVEGLAAVVALEEGDELGGGAVVVEEAAEPEGALQAEGDLGLHVGELGLDELRGGEGAVELLAVEGVLAGSVEAVFGGAHGCPSRCRSGRG